MTKKISTRIARFLERVKLIERDAENCYLVDDGLGNNEMTTHQGHSVQYRIAVGPHAGKKVFTLKTLPAAEEMHDVSKVDGFSLHAGVAAKAHERSKLERLCRYISRPSVSEQRLSLTEHGKIRYELKKPYRNGTTHIIFEPLDFISKLAALVPVPGVHLTRYHGIFASHHSRRKEIIEIKGDKTPASMQAEEMKPEFKKRIRLTWSQRLKRVFDIDVTICAFCGGAVKIIASIEEPSVINKILSYLQLIPQSKQVLLPVKHAPPKFAM